MILPFMLMIFGTASSSDKLAPVVESPPAWNTLEDVRNSYQELLDSMEAALEALENSRNRPSFLTMSVEAEDRLISIAETASWVCKMLREDINENRGGVWAELEAFLSKPTQDFVSKPEELLRFLDVLEETLQAVRVQDFDQHYDDEGGTEPQALRSMLSMNPLEALINWHNRSKQDVLDITEGKFKPTLDLEGGLVWRTALRELEDQTAQIAGGLKRFEMRLHSKIEPSIKFLKDAAESTVEDIEKMVGKVADVILPSLEEMADFLFASALALATFLVLRLFSSSCCCAMDKCCQYKKKDKEGLNSTYGVFMMTNSRQFSNLSL